MKARIKIDGKLVEIEDIKKVSGIGNITGLMFRKNSPALLFEIKNRAIHSFFCPRFIAVWIFEGKVVEYKIVEPWKLSILPEKDFDKLIEIPINSKYQHLLEFFVDKTKLSLS